MFDKPIAYVDIETSGGSPATAAITEVAAIRVEGGHITEEYRSFVNPGRSLPYWITTVTGITDEDLVQAPSFEDIAYQLHSILSGAIFIAHNVRFDYSFIKKQLAASGYYYKPALLCTVRLSRALYPKAQGHSLEKILQRHNIHADMRHRALDDTKAIKAFTELAYKEHGHASFQKAVALQLKNQTLPPNMQPTDIQQLTNTPGVYIFEDETGRPLYVGKSKRLRARVLSHFTQNKEITKELKISQQAHRLRTLKTGSELEALLLESKLVKELLPLHNRQLRKQSQCIILIKEYDANGYARMHAELARTPPADRLDSIYGMYRSKAKVKSALEAKLRTFDLCSKLLGLEKTDRACFLYQLGKCRGGCIGKEAPAIYNLRLEEAMRLSRIALWPYDGPVELFERNNSRLIIHNWMIMGRKVTHDHTETFESIDAPFDMDTYRILRAHMKQYTGTAVVRPVSANPLLTS